MELKTFANLTHSTVSMTTDKETFHQTCAQLTLKPVPQLAVTNVNQDTPPHTTTIYTSEPVLIPSILMSDKSKLKL